mmetsp:Transcript_38788/g.57003  ORF Transcript_38788/g.57003 Transcript_38788/m.57003 type:complete len:129 (+) Transcript_38788:1006-1392(+)
MVSTRLLLTQHLYILASNKNCQSRKRNIRTGQMHYRDQGNLMSKECSRPHICIMQMLVCQDLIIRVNTNMNQDCKVQKALIWAVILTGSEVDFRTCSQLPVSVMIQETSQKCHCVKIQFSPTLLDLNN